MHPQTMLDEDECTAHPLGIDRRQELYPFILHLWIKTLVNVKAISNLSCWF